MLGLSSPAFLTGNAGLLLFRESAVEPLISLEQAAELLSLKPNQLYELCRNRSRCRQKHPIPKIRLGKRTLFRPSALQEWILKLEQTASK